MAYSTKCVSFDGVDEYATAANSTILSKEYNNAFSVSVWIAASDYATGNYFLGKMAGSPTYRGWAVYFTAAGALGLGLRSDEAAGTKIFVTFATGAPTGAWLHLVVTYNGSGLASGIKAYKNGVELLPPTVVYDALAAGTIVNAVNFWLGGAVQSSGGWIRNCTLTQVAVYSRVLSLAEVQWIYNSNSPRDLLGAGAPSPGPEAWWKCGTGDTHPTLLDSSGSGFSLTMTNMESGDILNDSPDFWYEQVTFDQNVVEQQVDGLEQWYGDVVPVPTPYSPVIGSWSPSPGSTIDRYDSISFSVTDPDDNLSRVVVSAEYPWGTEVVHNNTSFATGYAGGSTRTAITNGYSYSLVRDIGWSGPALTLNVYATDSTGQEAAPASFAFTVTNPAPAPAPPATRYYRMRGIDATCPVGQQPAYVLWTVDGTPDYTASELSPSALPCGSDPLTDVVDIQISGEWEE